MEESEMASPQEFAQTVTSRRYRCRTCELPEKQLRELEAAFLAPDANHVSLPVLRRWLIEDQGIDETEVPKPGTMDNHFRNGHADRG